MPTIIPDHLNGVGRPASYRDGDIAGAAQHVVRSILSDLADGIVNEEYAYGETSGRCRAITLAGGGPGYELLVTYDEDNEVDEVVLLYSEMGGRSACLIPSPLGEELVVALDMPPRDDE